MCKELATEQSDVRGVVLDHMKRETSWEDPNENLERLREIEIMLPLMSGTTAVPNPQEIIEMYFNFHPKEWRDKFQAVPRSIDDGTETVVSITRFMRQLYLAREKNKNKNNKRNNDGKPADGKDKDNNSSADANGNGNRRGSKKSRRNNKNKKSGDPQGNKNMCRRAGCKDAPPHAWESCWYNKNGKNYRPELAERNGRSDGGGRDGRSGRGGGRSDNCNGGRENQGGGAGNYAYHAYYAGGHPPAGGPGGNGAPYGPPAAPPFNGYYVHPGMGPAMGNGAAGPPPRGGDQHHLDLAEYSNSDADKANDHDEYGRVKRVTFRPDVGNLQRGAGGPKPDEPPSLFSRTPGYGAGYRPRG